MPNPPKPKVPEVRKVLSSVSDCAVDFLDLSRLTAEYGRVIYPCKACVSTAMPLSLEDPRPK